MENTYIISDGSNWHSSIIHGLNLSDRMLGYEELSTEWEFHDWISRNIKLNTSCLIIPVELGANKQNSVQGLRIAMHIRLMQNEVRYLPIVFISNREDWQIRQMLRDSHDKDHLDYIIGTNGTDLLKPNVDEIRAVIENIKPLNKENYKLDFYNNIHILPLEDIGKHSLANIWGALRLNEVLNLNAINDKNLINRTKELYFKYLRAFHEEDKSSFKDLQPLQCTGKRILLIDDEADKGWNDVLKAIFKGADFQSIDFKNKSFEDTEQEAISKSISEDWDLIFLDLRLNPSEEDTGDKLIKTEDYSGVKILKAIKNHNAGIQVIMLTASNKAWNMKKLLDLGADGYYIKESPEFNFSPAFTHESYKNLKEESKKCLELKYLQEIFTIHNRCPNSLPSLEIAFELLKKSAIEKRYLNFAYLTYYQILEDYADRFFRFVSVKECYVDAIRVIDNSSNQLKWELTFMPDKINGDYFTRSIATLSKEVNVQYLAKISFLLAFKFNKDDNYLKQWGKLNNLRNTKAGHGGNGGFVTVEDIKELLEIVELFLTNQ